MPQVYQNMMVQMKYGRKRDCNWVLEKFAPLVEGRGRKLVRAGSAVHGTCHEVHDFREVPSADEATAVLTGDEELAAAVGALSETMESEEFSMVVKAPYSA